MSKGGRLTGAGPRARLPERRRRADPVVGPVRTCVGCRERGLRSVLIRVVVVAGGSGKPRAVVDIHRALPGRGAWVHADLRCLDLAERRRAFPRALRMEVLDTASVRRHLEEAAGGGRSDGMSVVHQEEAGWKPMGTR